MFPNTTREINCFPKRSAALDRPYHITQPGKREHYKGRPPKHVEYGW